MEDYELKQFAVTLFVDGSDKETVKKEIEEALKQSFSLDNIEVHDVEELE